MGRSERGHRLRGTRTAATVEAGSGSGYYVIRGVGGTLYQGLLVHADGRFVADLEVGGGVVRALRMARSDAAGGAGWRDRTGTMCVVLSRRRAVNVSSPMVRGQ